MEKRNLQETKKEGVVEVCGDQSSELKLLKTSWYALGLPASVALCPLPPARSGAPRSWGWFSLRRLSLLSRGQNIKHGVGACFNTELDMIRKHVVLGKPEMRPMTDQ